MVWSCAGFETLGAETLCPERQWLEILLVCGIKLRPVTGVLFRPKEIHACSPERPSLRWPTDFTVSITDERIRLKSNYSLVASLYHDRLATIEAWSIHTNGLPWK